MSFDLANIKITPKNFSYVVIWKKPLEFIPPMSTEFFKRLFKSEKIEYRFVQQGLTVSMPVENTEVPSAISSQKIFKVTPTPHLIMGYASFVFLHTNYDEFLRVYEQLIIELSSKYSSFYSGLKSAQIGINTEYEVLFPIGTGNSKYLKERFIGQKNETFGFKDVLLLDILFQLVEEGVNKLMQVKVQPFWENSNGVFINVNDHFGVSPTERIFSIDQLDKYYKRSIAKIESQVLPFLVTY